MSIENVSKKPFDWEHPENTIVAEIQNPDILALWIRAQKQTDTTKAKSILALVMTTQMDAQVLRTSKLDTRRIAECQAFLDILASSEKPTIQSLNVLAETLHSQPDNHNCLSVLETALKTEQFLGRTIWGRQANKDHKGLVIAVWTSGITLQTTKGDIEFQFHSDEIPTGPRLQDASKS